jgi:hypothetical protein
MYESQLQRTTPISQPTGKKRPLDVYVIVLPNLMLRVQLRYSRNIKR